MAKSNKNHHLEERNGCWYFRSMVNGKRNFVMLSTSVLDARRKRDQMLSNPAEDPPPNSVSPSCSTITQNQANLFGEVTVAWAKAQENRIAKNQLKSTTWRDWRCILNSKILPMWGNTPIQNINITAIEDFVESLTCGPKRVNNILVPLRAIFKFAKRKGFISDNPLIYIENLKVEQDDIYPLTIGEITILLRTISQHYRNFLTVAVFTGMRFGEMAALKWKNVDFSRKIIRVRETRVYGEEGRPKTAKSKRDIDMLPHVLVAMQNQKLASEKGEYVFRDQLGNLMTTDHFREVIWKPALEKAGIKYRPPMQTRHTFATLMIDAGEDLGWVKQMMGHSSLQMIYTRYYSWVKKVTRDDGKAFLANASTAELVQAIHG